MASILPSDFKWNQAEISNPEDFTDALIKIIAFDSDRRPYLLGNGFIIAAFDHKAIACTAAHLFTGIQKIQYPNPKHHSSALREFLPNGLPLKLNCELVRAIAFRQKRVEVTVIDWVMWDQSSDIAFFSIRLQNNSKNKFFESYFHLDDSKLELGDEVVVLGFGGMATQNEYKIGNGFETFQVKSQLILRRGSISNICPNGYRLCKDKCIETTIPVMPGLSGSPVMKFGDYGEQMRPFGLVSSDVSALEVIEEDRTISGNSIVPLINSRVNWHNEGQIETLLKLDNALCERNPELLDDK